MRERELAIFEGRLAGYQITLPNVMVGGDVYASYDREERYWVVEQHAENGTWRGTGANHTEAYLNLIAVRLGLPDPGPVIRAALDVAQATNLDDTAQARQALGAALDEYSRATE